MKTQNVKKAISLIVLVLTVVVMIILTAVAITSISNGGIFNKANVATFKTMVASMKEEFVAYNSNELLTQLNGYYNIGEYNSKFLGADETSLTYKGVAIENKNITDVLKSIKGTSYVSSFLISQGEIIYTGHDENLSAVASEILYNRSDVTTASTTGETSVTVSSASDEYLKDYTIYGKSEQDGTPTPTQPIPVFSLGERTRNLFDETLLLEKSYFTKVSGGYLADGYAISYLTTNELVKSLKENIKPNTDYTLTRNSIGTMQGASGRIRAYDASDNILFTISTGTGVRSEQFNLTQEQIDSLETIVFYGNSTTQDFIYNYIQLEEGTTSTDYIPYNAVEVKSRGKNLTPMPNNYQGHTIISPNITLEAGTYTLTVNAILTPAEIKARYSVDNSEIAHRYSKNQLTFTLNETAEINWFVYNTGYTSLSDILNAQLEEGTTATSYEPYQEPQTAIVDLTGHEPLRKIGDVADYIDYKNSRIVRNIGKYVFNGDEAITMPLSNSFRYVDTTLNAKRSNTSITTKCTHFVSDAYNNVFGSLPTNNTISTGPNNIAVSDRFGIYSTNFATVAEIQSYFLAQYNAGTPVTVYYQLAEPTYEAIDLPKIPVYSNGSITVEGASNISVVYIQTK